MIHSGRALGPGNATISEIMQPSEARCTILAEAHSIVEHETLCKNSQGNLWLLLVSIFAHQNRYIVGACMPQHGLRQKMDDSDDEARTS